MASPPHQDHILLLPQVQPTDSGLTPPSAASTPSLQQDQQLPPPAIGPSQQRSTLLPNSNLNNATNTTIPRTQSPSTTSSIYNNSDLLTPDYNNSPSVLSSPSPSDVGISSNINSNSNNNHSTGTSTRDQGSKSSLLFHQSLWQSFLHYLSTSDRESPSAKASFPPFLRRLPPWLLPRYHKDFDDDSIDDEEDQDRKNRARYRREAARSRRPQWTRGRVVRSVILRPLCRLLLLWVILAIVIAATIVYSFRPGQPELVDYAALTSFDWTPINPRSYLSPMNATFGDQYDTLLDGHSHSVYSDGRMSPDTLLKWHIANGFNAVIVSDHNTIEGGLAAQKLAMEKYAGQITVIPAMELSCCRLHMNLIGINETIDIAMHKWPTDDQLKATIARTHELGGLAIINHIPWSNTTEYGYELPRMQNHPSRETLVEMGIDGFEIVNGGTLDTISLKFIQDHNLLLMTGTDVHYPDANAFSWTILNTNNNRTAANILTELKARRTSFLFDPTGTQPLAYPPESHAYYRTAPPTLLGQYFQMFWNDQTGMYSFQPEGGFCHEEFVTIRWRLIGYFIGWILIGFLIFEAARLLVVGCCWGPFQRRRRYLRKKRWLAEEQRERTEVPDSDVDVDPERQVA
ncbi:hypothetical protein BGZ83_002414 [Gryganskiella cystojenkinii]|nr:hypothetical protein BGZ83_002414 [Gryganskiella cystojenkinii]